MKTPGLYVPLDVNYVSDEGIRRAGAAAELLYIRGLAYSKRTQSDGFLPDYDLAVISVGLPTVREAVTALVERELWLVADGGWQIRSWRRWNEVHGDTAEKRKRAAERQRRSRERKAEQVAQLQAQVTESDEDGDGPKSVEEADEADPEEVEPDSVTAPVTRDSTRTSRVTSRTSHTPKEKRREETTEEKTTTSSDAAKASRIRPTADADFDQFYGIYPRHEAKADAAKAYKAAIKAGVDKQKILTAATAYATHVAGKDPEFIKLPAGWLRSGRYDDELPAPGSFPPLRAVAGGYQPWTNPADQNEYDGEL